MGRHREYGSLSFKGTTVGAHRIAYELTYGEIPKGLDICHECDNPICCNPAHLRAGTESDNMQDCLRKRRYPCGQDNPVSKLTDDQVREMRRRLADGETSVTLAKEFGVSQNLVSLIRRRKRWAWLD